MFYMRKHLLVAGGSAAFPCHSALLPVGVRWGCCSPVSLGEPPAGTGTWCEPLGAAVPVQGALPWASGPCCVFCRPDLVDMERVQIQSNRENLEQAFEIAERLGVTRLLDAEGERLARAAGVGRAEPSACSGLS